MGDTLRTREDAMSQIRDTAGYDNRNDARNASTERRRVSTETKASVKTTELIAFVVVGVAMMVASQIVDGFDAQHAWFYLTLLTIGYMVSRGLAKSGSRDFYDDGYDQNSR
jgi:hypothetical protein